MLAIRPVFAPVAPFAPGTVEVRSAGGESAPAGLSDEAQREDDPERSCTNCRHRLKPGTCAEPIAAGLLTEEQGYGIVWPAQGYGAACAAFALVKGLS